MPAILWNCGDGPLPVGRFDLAFAPQLDDFNGTTSVLLKVLDWRAADVSHQATLLDCQLGEPTPSPQHLSQSPVHNFTYRVGCVMRIVEDVVRVDAHESHFLKGANRAGRNTPRPCFGTAEMARCPSAGSTQWHNSRAAQSAGLGADESEVRA